MKEQRHIIYRGQVQGVGFWMTTVRIAKGFHITGYVKNLADGSVELIAEGEREEIRSFIAELEERMEANIREKTENRIVAAQAHSDFSVHLAEGLENGRLR